MDIDKAKEELSEESKKIVSELEGKSNDEIKAMEDEASAELQEQIYRNATEYVYNLLELGKEPYSDEVYDKYISELNAKRAETVPEEGFYSNFDNNMITLQEIIIRNGYSIGGKKFVDTIIDNDPESAKILLESAIQRYLEMNATIEQINIMANLMAEKAKQKEEK